MKNQTTQNSKSPQTKNILTVCVAFTKKMKQPFSGLQLIANNKTSLFPWNILTTTFTYTSSNQPL